MSKTQQHTNPAEEIWQILKEVSKRYRPAYERNRSTIKKSRSSIYHPVGEINGNFSGRGFIKAFGAKKHKSG